MAHTGPKTFVAPPMVIAAAHAAGGVAPTHGAAAAAGAAFPAASAASFQGPPRVVRPPRQRLARSVSPSPRHSPGVDPDLDGSASASRSRSRSRSSSANSTTSTTTLRSLSASPRRVGAAGAAAAVAAASPSPPSSPSTLSTASSFPSDLDQLIADRVPDGSAAALQLGETVPYHESTAKGRGVTGDGLTGDHIPAAAALKRYGAAHGDPRSKTKINSQGLTAVITDADHKQFSRTYGGRNTDAQITRDSNDLPGAIYRDIRTYGHKMSAAGVLTPEMMATMASVYRDNAGPKNPLPAGERPPLKNKTTEMIRHYVRKSGGGGGGAGGGAAGGGGGAAGAGGGSP